jgi:ABC-type Fe3+ transport system substrate-binding protein
MCTSLTPTRVIRESRLGPLPKRLDLLAYVACPIKQAFRDHIDAVASRYRDSTGRVLDYHVPMGCRDEDEYDDIASVTDIADVPEIVASVGFGDFMTPDFGRRFVSQGHFRSVWKEPVHGAFARSGLVDPQGWFTPYSVWAHVLLVDLTKLGRRPVPRRWSDLLDPGYEDQIVSDGAHDQKFAPVPLLHFYKEFGEAGLIRLAKNIRETWHPAQMVKVAGSAESKGVAIYIVPWSFACARKWPPNVCVVWPEEGAISSPAYALVKTHCSAAAEVIAKELVGEELGRRCAQAGFPSLNSRVDNLLPGEASFTWLGWDYVRRENVRELIRHTSDLADRAWASKVA